ncbi:SusD/RagB family nutrient-binding outer membrane lipoprotein [Sinomicrobium weinanense]|uniref:SusD/RagB family nutrient-binding outer membrane lipoprotein n=1 Tax=Sinomicrobium weinanense TaxID=2842200 RepID=A0A926JNU2_9FLAO|nr:SusD/RagB family nutrient-binding outer membrane lipoprotein [Sinomicrobium weinanense]MBC9794717.1 SusD/RagB family nutrient-binding outer membrane lipoprotein [Sinomicrobium weinanense]MBU3124976.1 SusD/RagB family nutrient-binding outer membrane lipoprotein [Sinomicrobium weinanense]
MKFRSIYILLFILSLSVIACDDYLDINENPNGAEIPPLKGLLAYTTHQTAVNTYRLGTTTSYYTQYLASPNEASATDIQERVNTDNSWENIYEVMSDAYDIEALATESNSPHYVGVSKVLMAANLGMSIDVWGGVPYSEALAFETLTPAYDNDEALYTTVISLLDEAVSELDKANEGTELDPDSDFIHGGGTEAWIKTAYALKARYLNHLSGTDKYDPSAVLNALDNAYESNDDDAQVTQFQTRNPWAQVALSNEQLVLGGWLSEQLIDAMNGTTFDVFDPRLPLITEPFPVESGGDTITIYRGTVNGAGRIGDGTIQAECYLTTGGFYSSTNAPLILISYSELKFIEAEVNLHEGNSAAAYDAYLAGIRANMEKVGVAAGDITAYTSDATVAVGTAITTDDIFREKYIAMFLHPESWVDARRFDYGYKDFTLPENHNSLLNGQFIRRFDYPDTEYLRNRNNVPEVELLTRIWWDND